MNDVELKLDHAAIAALAMSPEVKFAMMRLGSRAAAASAGRAPKLSGAGAASIRPEYILDGMTPEVRVSWDREHYYMYFHEKGTRYLPARPFMTTGGSEDASGPEFQSDL